MPMTPETDFLLMPDAPRFEFGIEPAQNAVNSLLLLTRVEMLSGLGEWVERTAASLPAERLRLNRVVVDGLYHAVAPEQRWPTFEDYVVHLAAADPVELRDRLVERLRRGCLGKSAAQGRRVPPAHELVASLDA